MDGWIKGTVSREDENPAFPWGGSRRIVLDSENICFVKDLVT